MNQIIIALVILFLISFLFIWKFMERNGKLSDSIIYKRDMLDDFIIRVESWCKNSCTIDNVSGIFLKLYHNGVHFFARMTAKITKKIENKARFAAHKSAKAKNELSQNTYLTEVQEHKDSLDTIKVADESKL